MLSIGQFAKLAQISTRTIRYYESINLLPRTKRGENNYRFYEPAWLGRVVRIRELQGLGFGLGEIQTVLGFENSELHAQFQRRLTDIEQELGSLQRKRDRLYQLLSVTQKNQSGKPVDETERKLLMQAIREEIIHGMKQRYGKVTDIELAYLERDRWFHTHEGMNQFLKAVKSCLQFAKERGLRLGPGRGSAPASMTLYGLGFSSVEPMKHAMIPDRLTTQPPVLHIDVEFARGQELVDHCRELNKNLSFGEIQAFKMPLIDIIQDAHRRIGQIIDYDSISDDADEVLNTFRAADIRRIFGFDFSPDALVMKYENFLPGYEDIKKMTGYLRSQKVRDFRDVINITSLWRPHSPQMIERIKAYKDAKKYGFRYEFLSLELQESLKPNFGRVLYHEDLLRIIHSATGWEMGRCNLLRRSLHDGDLEKTEDGIEFKRFAQKELVDLVLEESKWAFCLPHAVAFAKFTKQTAVLKTLHQSVYQTAIQDFEQRHGFRWDDIGIRMKGISLLQD